MNHKSAQLWSLVAYGLSLAYSVFLLIYLDDNKKFVPQMSERDRKFRTAAIVITWINLILMAIAMIGIVIELMSGEKMGSSMVSSASPSELMGWY